MFSLSFLITLAPLESEMDFGPRATSSVWVHYDAPAAQDYEAILAAAGGVLPSEGWAKVCSRRRILMHGAAFSDLCC